MKHYINTIDNTIWAFEDDVNPFDFASTPATLELIIEERPSNEHQYENGVWTIPTPVVIIPSSITMRQCRLQLLSQGLLDDVEALIQSASQASQIEWEYATTVERSSSLVDTIAQSLTMSTEDLDLFFTNAAQL